MQDRKLFTLRAVCGQWTGEFVVTEPVAIMVVPELAQLRGSLDSLLLSCGLCSRWVLQVCAVCGLNRDPKRCTISVGCSRNAAMPTFNDN